MLNPSPVTKSCITTHLKRPQISALYLSDALATGRENEILTAFRDIRGAVQDPDQHKIRNFEMTLKDVIEILTDADLQLVAIRRPEG